MKRVNRFFNRLYAKSTTALLIGLAAKWLHRIAMKRIEPSRLPLYLRVIVPVASSYGWLFLESRVKPLQLFSSWDSFASALLWRIVPTIMLVVIVGVCLVPRSVAWVIRNIPIALNRQFDRYDAKHFGHE